MTMKAFVLSEFDRAPEVAEVDVPAPGPGEVRVRVAAASVNGFDLSVAKGMLNGAMEHRFPVVLGKDFAGTVDAVGEGVDDYAVGDRVFGVVTKDFLGDGSLAEFVTVPTSVGIAKLPSSVDFTEAAGLGLAGTAALMAVDAANISEGATVLVVGATGAVGQQAVQLAARAGARVIATAASDAEIANVTALGSSETVDYTADVVDQVRALAPGGADVVLHFAGDPQAAIEAAAVGGVFVSTMLPGPDDVAAENVRVESIYAHPSPDTLQRLARNQAEKHTTVTVQSTHSLEDAAAAFAEFGQGTLGKIVVSIS